MKNSLLIAAVILFFSGEISSQVVKGKIVDENQMALAGLDLKLFANQNIFNTTTLSDGSFSFSITKIENEQLPTGYAVSNNFPNPFNPITRINFTLPNGSNVRIEVFNILGQNVKDMIEQYFDAGTNFIDIELNGLPNGMYISRITIDNKYTVVKKMMLVYGSQHLITGGNIPNLQLGKSNNNYNTYLEANLDSLIAASSIIGKKTFKNLPSLIGDTLDLGSLTIERYCIGTPTVTYDGKIYNTVQIGTKSSAQCWLKENLNLGTRINGSTSQSNNGTLEKYCYNDDPANCQTYGGLYQWNEAMQYVTTSKAKGICPPDWHLPTNEEYLTLKTTLSNDGNSLKAIGQGSGSGSGTNNSGFAAILSGMRNQSSLFENSGVYTYFWSSSNYDATNSLYMSLSGTNSNINLSNIQKDFAFSVRCIKDSFSFGPPPEPPLLSSPANGATNVALTLTLVWNKSIDATSYNLQVATDDLFSSSSLVYNLDSLTGTSQQVTVLNYLTTYYWRVNATNKYGKSGWSSPTWSFTTKVAPIIGFPCPTIPTITDPRNGKVYNTIQIGIQCWLKENLDIGIIIGGNSSDNGILEKYCYNSNPANCQTHGGLYQWDEAMQYVNTEGAKGICPDGWHIPTRAEVQKLVALVDGDGNALKAIGEGTGAGAGTNTSGFSALMGLWVHNPEAPPHADTYFWNSTEYDANNAFSLSLFKIQSGIAYNAERKTSGFSIRCIKDSLVVAPEPVTLSSPVNGAWNLGISLTFIWNKSTGATSYTLQIAIDSLFSSLAYNQGNLTGTSQQVTGLKDSTKYFWRVNANNNFGTSGWSSPIWSFTTGVPCPGIPTITDPRDGKVYNTTLIGSQCWLKENLDVGTRISRSTNQSNNSTIEKYCYNDDPVNCQTYGGLYQWNEAMQYVKVPGTQGICPIGWHLPTLAEFLSLRTTVNTDAYALIDLGQVSGATNSSGFSALFGGYRSPNTAFGRLNSSGYFSSSTEYISTEAYYLYLGNGSLVDVLTFDKTGGYSVRCLKD